MGANVNHLLSIVTAVIEGICFTGVIYGWSSLSYVLAIDGYFYKECSKDFNSSLNYSADDQNYPQCNEQKESLVLVAAISLGAMTSSQMIAGIIYDTYGTLMTRLCGTTAFTIACFIVAFSTPDASWLLYPGFSLMAFGGGMLIVPNMKIGNLFKAKRATVISLTEGCIDSSGIVFLFVKLAYQSGITIRTAFLVIALCTIIQWIRTLFFMPRMHIPYPLPEEGFALGLFHKTKTTPMKETKMSQSIITNSNTSICELQENEKQNKPPPLLSSVKDYRFWLNCMHSSILGLRVTMFIVSLGDWLQATFPGSVESEISMYINVFGYMCLSVVFLASFNGFCVDKLQKYFKEHTSNERVATSKATAIMLTVTSLLGVLFSIAVCVPNLSFQYVSFSLLFMLIACLFGGHSSFNALIFPEEHFGRINGLSKSISTIISFLQYPLVIFVHRVYNGSFLIVNVGFIVSCAITLVHPVVLYRWVVRAEKTNDLERIIIPSFSGTNRKTG